MEGMLQEASSAGEEARARLLQAQNHHGRTPLAAAWDEDMSKAACWLVTQVLGMVTSQVCWIFPCKDTGHSSIQLYLQ